MPIKALLLCLVFLPAFDHDAGANSIRGIDISHHQGRLDWAKIRDQGFRFCYIKCSEGRTLRDSLFAHNLSIASAHGLLTGAYHYLSFCVDGVAQAENFIAALGDRHLDLPPVADIEYVGNCRNRPDRKVLLARIHAFLETVAGRLKRPVIIYTTEEFYRDYLTEGFDQYSFWIRNLESRPVHYENRRVVVWQYAVKRIDGARTKVDHNVYLGDSTSLMRLVSKPHDSAPLHSPRD